MTKVEFTDIIRKICKNSAEIIGANAASVFMKVGNKLVIFGKYGYSEKIKDKSEYDIGEGITGYIGLGNPVRLNTRSEIKNHPYHKGKYDNDIWGDNENRCESILGLPMKIGEYVYGIIKVESKEINGACTEFTQKDEDTLTIFLKSISDVLQTNSDLLSELYKPYVFVLMPFEAKYKNIYFLGIKPIIQKMNMECQRSDEIIHDDNILQIIYSCIKKADIIISVLSGNNANVFFETGYCHALNKKIIHLRDKSETIPFDLFQINHILYDPDDLSILQRRIEERIEHYFLNLIN
jgi:hypothetical protein